MKINLNKRSRIIWRAGLILVSIALLCVAGVSIFRIRNDASRSLASLRARADLENEIPFSKTVRSMINNQQIRLWQNTNNVRAVAHFREFIFAATDGGLLQFSENGKLIKHWTVLDGLTESDLTCLAVFNDQLFIGTNSTGLLAFDGARFENYVWRRNQAAKSVNALLPDDGRLLIGTFAGGLIEFDGSGFREIKAENQSLIAVNFLSKNDQRLFVGTFDNGLWLREAGRWQHFTTAEGLLSNRIVGVVAHNNNIFVATDLGIVAANKIEPTSGKVFSTIASLPTLTSLVKTGDEIFAVKDNGDIFALVGEKAQTFSPLSVTPNSLGLTSAQLSLVDKNCWLVGSQGIFRREQNSFVRFSDFNKENLLANNAVSALAVDANNRIWAGTFRRGVDVFESNGRKFKHFESENIREINFILPAKDNILVATAGGGAAKFDKSLLVSNFTKTDGLLSNSVSHISANSTDDQNQRFFATSRGLSFQTTNGWRGLTTVNGLPSNNVYTTLNYKNSLFVGTLGGLAEVQNGRVVRTFTDANSALAQNWVTALSKTNERIFIGTYGGGIFELTSAGEVHAFAAETGKFIVNPNAMFADGENLYAGTLEGAWILNLSEQKWTHLTDELPSQTILSITGDAENIYFGTTGGIAKINKNYFRAEK